MRPGWTIARALSLATVLVVNALALPLESFNTTFVGSNNRSGISAALPAASSLGFTRPSINATQVSNLSWPDLPWVRQRDDLYLVIDRYSAPTTSASQAQLAVAAFNFMLSQHIASMASINNAFPVQPIQRWNHGVQLEVTPAPDDEGDLVPVTGHDVKVLGQLLWEWIDAFDSEDPVPSTRFTLMNASDGHLVAIGVYLCRVLQPDSAYEADQGNASFSAPYENPAALSRRDLNSRESKGANTNLTHGTNSTDHRLHMSPYEYGDDFFTVKLFEQSPINVTGFEMTALSVEVLTVTNHEFKEYGTGDIDHEYPDPWFQVETDYLSLNLAGIHDYDLTFAIIYIVGDTLRSWCPPGILDNIMSLKIKVYDSHTKEVVAEGRLFSLVTDKSNLTVIAKRDGVQNISLSRSTEEFTVTSGDFNFTFTNYKQPTVGTYHIQVVLATARNDIWYRTSLMLMGIDSTVSGGLYEYPHRYMDFTVEEKNGYDLKYTLVWRTLAAIEEWAHSGGVIGKIPSTSIRVVRINRPDVVIASATLEVGMTAKADTDRQITPVAKRDTVHIEDLSNTTTGQESLGGEPLNGPKNASGTALNNTTLLNLRPLDPDVPDTYVALIPPVVVLMFDYHPPFTTLNQFAHLLEYLDEEFSLPGRGPGERDEDRMYSGQVVYGFEDAIFDISEQQRGKLTWGVALKVVDALRDFLLHWTAGELIPSMQFSVSGMHNIGIPIVKGAVNFDFLGGRNETGRLCDFHDVSRRRSIGSLRGSNRSTIEACS